MLYKPVASRKFVDGRGVKKKQKTRAHKIDSLRKQQLQLPQYEKTLDVV